MNQARRDAGKREQSLPANHQCDLQLSNVCHTYRDGFELQVSELCVTRDSVVCLMGPTGAGKSTLLRLMSGLLSPNSGQVVFDARPLTDDDRSLALRRRMAVVFQTPRLLARSVRENVTYGLHLRGRSQSCSEQVDQLLDRLDLARIQRQAASSLSGGQAQLVALARALAVEPEFLFLDEPTANLDPARVALVEEIVRETRAARGMTVVWATHNLFQARRVSDRVIFLLEGRIIETADTNHFFQSPTDPRSADFIEGRMIY